MTRTSGVDPFDRARQGAAQWLEPLRRRRTRPQRLLDALDHRVGVGGARTLAAAVGRGGCVRRRRRPRIRLGDLRVAPNACTVGGGRREDGVEDRVVTVGPEPVVPAFREQQVLDQIGRRGGPKFTAVAAGGALAAGRRSSRASSLPRWSSDGRVALRRWRPNDGRAPNTAPKEPATAPSSAAGPNLGRALASEGTASAKATAARMGIVQARMTGLRPVAAPDQRERPGESSNSAAAHAAAASAKATPGVADAGRSRLVGFGIERQAACRFPAASLPRSLTTS